MFRTDDAGGSWTPWDDGLPNAPVYDLAVHGASRLLRAATFGRSMWERPIDDTNIPLVDVYMRDNVIDTGRASPSLNGVSDPFDPSILVHHWQSPDIKVDAQEGSPPAFQTDAVVDNYVDFAARVEHRNPQRGVTNRVYVQVLSRGVNAATNVKVRCFFAEAHAGLPPLPADFWTSGRPFSGTPSGPDWTPVGPSYTFPTLAPGQPGIAEWNFKVPSSASEHSCLLAVATSDEDPLDAGGILDISPLVTTQKLVTLKNLQSSTRRRACRWRGRSRCWRAGRPTGAVHAPVPLGKPAARDAPARGVRGGGGGWADRPFERGAPRDRGRARRARRAARSPDGSLRPPAADRSRARANAGS